MFFYKNDELKNIKNYTRKRCRAIFKSAISACTLIITKEEEKIRGKNIIADNVPTLPPVNDTSIFFFLIFFLRLRIELLNIIYASSMKTGETKYL